MGIIPRISYDYKNNIIESLHDHVKIQENTHFHVGYKMAHNNIFNAVEEILQGLSVQKSCQKWDIRPKPLIYFGNITFILMSGIRARCPELGHLAKLEKP